MLNGWGHVAIGGKRVDVFTPSDPLPFVLLYLHSLAEETPATDSAFTFALNEHRLRCLAPRGGGCWWGDRICPEFDANLTPERYLLQSLLPCVQTAWGLSSRAV